MLSDEEKQSIESLKNIAIYIGDNYTFSQQGIRNLRENLRIVLPVIEKQSKEIEHQKEKRANQKKELAILNAKQIEFNKLVNTVNSYKGQFKRQEKEIEELKKKNKPQPDCAEPIERIEEMVNMRWVNHKYISKDKILELLGIEEETDNEKILSLLQTLVDENNRLEDIEDKKVQIEYNNVFNKGVKSVEDKIKAKIEELEIEQESNREDLKIAIDNLLVQNIDKIANKISINMSIRGILQSLLEKEE